MTTEQDKRRKAAAASKVVQALAQVVVAGRAGQPPAPDALDVLATALQALQDGADPGKVLGLKRATAGKPPGGKELEARAVRRMLELRNQRLDLSDAKVAELVAAELGVNPDTLYDNWWVGKGKKNQKVDDRVERTYGKKVVKRTPLRVRLEREQQDDAHDAAEPPAIPDRPDASEDFRD
ncbi:hypothetical protein [Hydrogenophaga luteola]|uniref:Uncharacterized protein n=1 Tax=Hydrogenophaga luteola TaxID=1591122 RepID=A0ABV7W2Y7_9BURK